MQVTYRTIEGGMVEIWIGGDYIGVARDQATAEQIAREYHKVVNEAAQAVVNAARASTPLTP